MKFLALKEALIKVLKDLDLKDSKPTSPGNNSKPSPTTTPSPVFYPFPTPSSKGVNDGISRDPIDRTARLVTAKAPWWAKPPPEPKQPPEPKTKTSKTMANNKIMERNVLSATGSGRPIIKSFTGPNGEPLFSMDDVVMLCVQEIKKDLPPGLRELALSAKECREVLDASTHQAASVMEEFRKTSSDLLALLRDTRFATVNETRQIMAQLRDVREFFLGDKHQEQVKRLSEFVDLCERLQKLNDSGFLNAVADTILKLS